MAHLYHVRLLQDIKGEFKINLSYFFSRTLIKMKESVKNENKPKEAQVYHQRLIKILVEHQVRTQGIIWKEFLVQNQHEVRVIEE